MGEPYIGEIRIFAGNFAPAGWAFCDGQLMAISDNDALFTLIGTTYGGDGQSTFALPDLRGRVLLHQGQGGGLSNYVLGQSGGVESVTLTTQQLTNHTHALFAASSNQVTSPTGAQMLAEATSTQSGLHIYRPSGSGTNIIPSSISSVGGGQPHENRQPFLGVNFIISLFGIFPSQT
ncbi:MAG: phage tail protein [Methylobacteriaceae bacterium]|nr:phage tail protein [Methylobacteriaceae bacterium]